MLHFSSWETFLCSCWLCALQEAILEEIITLLIVHYYLIIVHYYLIKVHYYLSHFHESSFKLYISFLGQINTNYLGKKLSKQLSSEEIFVKGHLLDILHTKPSPPILTYSPVHQYTPSSSSCSPGQTVYCESFCVFSSESFLRTDCQRTEQHHLEIYIG